MNWLTGIPLIGDVIKTVFGDKAAREIQGHTEKMAVYNQFAAEFGHSKTWFDSLIDGLNRLPRPLMTFGTIWLFYYCINDPEGFSVSAIALQQMPKEGWWVLSAIIVFWFGGKLPKDFGKLSTVNKKQKHLPIKKHQKSEAKDPEWGNRVDKRYDVNE